MKHSDPIPPPPAADRYSNKWLRASHRDAVGEHYVSQRQAVRGAPFASNGGAMSASALSPGPVCSMVTRPDPGLAVRACYVPGLDIDRFPLGIVLQCRERVFPPDT